jgi:hypothetical protein
MAPYYNCTRRQRYAPGGFNVTNAATCRELNEAHCVRRVACPCIVEEHRPAFTDLANSSVQIYATNLSHLSYCVLDIAQCDRAAATAARASQSSSRGSSRSSNRIGPFIVNIDFDDAVAFDVYPLPQSSGGQASATSGASSTAFALFPLRQRSGVGAMVFLGAMFVAVTASATIPC